MLQSVRFHLYHINHHVIKAFSFLWFGRLFFFFFHSFRLQQNRIYIYVRGRKYRKKIYGYIVWFEICQVKCNQRNWHGKDEWKLLVTITGRSLLYRAIPSSFSFFSFVCSPRFVRSFDLLKLFDSYEEKESVHRKLSWTS